MKRMLLAALLLVVVSTPARAQESDLITGRVIDEAGDALPGARVEAMSIESEITRSVLTDRNGRFMINFADGGGRYLLRVSFLGKADYVRTVVRAGDEELLLANVTMTSQAIQLDPVTATARRPQPSQGRTGEQSTELPQDLLNRLPLPDLDPSTVALLATGVIATELDSLSGRAGFSVAGMSDLLNQILLDGMVLGESGLQIPQEGVRRTSVTTSTFDASRGGFAGGQVSMTSARGNNRTAGALSYSLDNDAFQLGSAATVNAYSRQNIGASIGGPLVHNKLFFNAALGIQRNVNHRFALAPNDELSALRAGVAADSVNRFIAALSAQGIPLSGDGTYDQLRDNISLQLRSDWNLLQRDNQAHTLSLRLNGSNTSEDSTRINTLDLTQHGGEVEHDNWAAALAFNSRFGNSWTNALIASFNESWNNALPYIAMPEGRVLVTSVFDDDTRGIQRLVFGGNRNLPSDAYTKSLQLSNDLSFLLPIGSQLHRLKLGASLRESRVVSRSIDNIFGSFSYNSIADLENKRPARFERTLADEYSRVGSMNAAIYIGDTWRVSEPLEITAGLRWDHTRMAEKPAYNSALDSVFGRRTDIEPVVSTLSPRLGFNYRLASSEGVRSARTISGGIGLFAGQTPSSIFATAARQTGLPDAERRLICIGNATPVPDWDLYLADPAAIPTTCADGSAGNAIASRLPTVTLINPDQSMPASLRAELGYRTRLPLNINANIRYSYARGYGLWGYYDINLNESGFFMMGAEGRPFFGNESAIVARTGHTTFAASRQFGQFGHVTDIRADRSSASHQITTQIGGQLPKGITLSANYTLGFARDQASGNLGFAPTADSPNRVEWAPSNQDRRHTINLTVSKAITQEFEVTAMARLSSGSPFTPMVGGDINGDGFNNDRAFVFNAGSRADTSLINGMARLLDVVSDRIADCLTEQSGRIAGRNSCRNRWSRSLDLRASVRPNLPRLERRLTVSIDANNLLNGLDQLFNGDDPKGWGENQRVENRLLEVRGFDVANGRFVYEVNEAFGQNRRGSSAIRNPFALRLTARVALGGQPVMSNRGFRTFAGGGGGGGFNAVGLIDRLLANPIIVLLELKDTLGLQPEQLSKIQAISDSLQQMLAKQRAELGKKVASMSAQDQQRVFVEIQPAIQATRREVTNALKQVEAVLAKEQWQRVPAELRNPFQRGPRPAR